MDKIIEHSGFLTDSSLYISKDSCFLGASPDGICQCDCCGVSILEIKTSSKHKGKTIKQALTDDKSLCINLSGSLKTTHPYFSQVQGQMAVTGFKQAFFVLWLGGENEQMSVSKLTFDQDI